MLQSCSDFIVRFSRVLTPQWGAVDAEIKVPSDENTCGVMTCETNNLEIE